MQSFQNKDTAFQYKFITVRIQVQSNAHLCHFQHSYSSHLVVCLERMRPSLTYPGCGPFSANYVTVHFVPVNDRAVTSAHCATNQILRITTAADFRPDLMFFAGCTAVHSDAMKHSSK